MKFEKNLLKIITISAVASIPVAVVNFLLFKDNQIYFSSLNIIAVMIFALPIALQKYFQYQKIKQMEEMFIIFLKDFVEAIRGGMTVPNAFKSVSINDYRVLNTYVKKMSAQMDWGIPVDQVFLNFSKSSKSKLIAKIISSVIESHRFGGNLAESFDALSNTSLEIERLRSERSLYLHSQMITGYIIFFVFLAVIISLGKFLIPGISGVSLSGTQTTTEASKAMADEYRSIFRNLIVIQAFFAGLMVGKMSEGSVIAGLKHSFFMMFVGIIAFIVAG